MKKIKRLKYLLLFVFCFVPFIASATSSVVNGLNETVSTGLLGGGQVSDQALIQEGIISSVPLLIGKVLGAGLALLGVIFMVLMIYGGFIWMGARGNEQEVEKAKNLIRAAIIGLVIIFSAYVVTVYLGKYLMPI